MVASSFDDRLRFDGKIEQVIERAFESYRLGNFDAVELMTVGFQDYNVKVTSKNAIYLVKIFSKKRDLGEAERCAAIVEAVLRAGVRHPKMYKTANGELLYNDNSSGLQLMIMDFISGKTFYEMGGSFQAPNEQELSLIAAEAVKINQTPHKPDYLFDAWAIPNMKWMYDKTKQHLSSEGDRLVAKAFEAHNDIPFKDLPHCLVHGDIIKTNVVMSEGRAYIIDFAVANTYPRIQELAVMAANLMFDGKQPLPDRLEKVQRAYQSNGGNLKSIEEQHLFNYTLPAAAMEYMGSVWERDVNGDDSPEIDYWIQVGFEGLKEAIK